MTASALVLVLLSAACHAWWNIVAKKSAGGPVFVWLFGLVSLLACAPLAMGLWLHHPTHFSPWMWGAALASGAIHVLYALVLQQGYRVSDFAVVYPVARGTGPMLSVFASVLWLGERPSPGGWVGIAAVLTGVLLCSGALKGRQSRAATSTTNRRLGVGWGLLTGLCIASYTVIDGWAIKTLGMVPLLFYFVGLSVRTLLLAPNAWQQRAQIPCQWRQHRTAILTVGLLSPLAYGLVLTALQAAPLSYVAPVREISMLIGTWMGARWLKESLSSAQMMGTGLMLAGVLALALS